MDGNGWSDVGYNIVEGEPTGYVADVVLGDNRLVDITSYGIQVSSGTTWSCIKDNRIRGTGNIGLNVTSTCRSMRVQGNDMRTSSVVVPSTDGGTSTDHDISPHNVPQAS